jgi:molybdate transport system ATP-binding protein
MDLTAQFAVSFQSGALIKCDLQLTLGQFELTVLFGPSGCGKTTILRCLAGLQRPTSGFIKAGDQTWFCSHETNEKPTARRGIGYVFQDSALFPHLSVEKNIAYGLYGWSKLERKARVAELIALMGLDGLALRRPSEISGGQKQRVALARALAPRPKIVLLDEPFVSLDQTAAGHLRSNLRQILKKLCVPTILVTHDYQEALALGDQMLLMSGGHIVKKGLPAEILSVVGSGVQQTIGMGEILRAKVTGRTNGLLKLLVGSVELLALDSGGDFQDVYICICSEGIMIESSLCEPTFQQNYFFATVVKVKSIGVLRQVYLDIGIVVKAIVTNWTCLSLQLQCGQRVGVFVNVSAIQVIPITP